MGLTGEESVQRAKPEERRRIFREGHVGAAMDDFPSCSFAGKPSAAGESGRESEAGASHLGLLREPPGLSPPLLS